jgi:hypothetical protein
MRQKCMLCQDIRIVIHIKEISMQDISSSASERHLSLYPFSSASKNQKNWESYLVMCRDLNVLAMAREERPQQQQISRHPHGLLKIHIFTIRNTHPTPS